MTTSHAPEDRSVNSSLLKAHTPGRLQSSHQFFSEGAPLFIASEAGQIVARIENRVSGRPLTQEDAENARRLVAAWNACEGISTENLEDNQPIRELAEKYNAALAQRSELLEALKLVVELMITPLEGATLRKARAAIKKVEAGE